MEDGTPNEMSLVYSRDGAAWEKYNIGEAVVLDREGDKVWFSAESENMVPLWCDDGFYFFELDPEKRVAASGNVCALLKTNEPVLDISGLDCCFA